jgi:hypothetical protein
MNCDVVYIATRLSRIDSQDCLFSSSLPSAHDFDPSGRFLHLRRRAHGTDQGAFAFRLGLLNAFNGSCS